MSLSELVPSTVGVGTPPEYSVRLLARRDGAQARAFCLRTIEEVFGHAYRPDWHADLDALRLADHDYQPARRGAFLLVHHRARLVGTAGLRALAATPHLEHRFADRYLDPSLVGSVWRTYLDSVHRSRGVGTAVLHHLEQQARDEGYRTLYLHTSGDSPRSVGFWRAQGYRVFATDDDNEATVHLDKELAA